MRKEKTIETKIRSDEVTKDAITYKYALVMRESARVASFRLPLYSISVEMRRDGEVISFAEANEIFADVGKAIAFYERMVKYLATPIDLPYIVEDELIL